MPQQRGKGQAPANKRARVKNHGEPSEPGTFSSNSAPLLESVVYLSNSAALTQVDIPAIRNPAGAVFTVCYWSDVRKRSGLPHLQHQWSAKFFTPCIIRRHQHSNNFCFIEDNRLRRSCRELLFAITSSPFGNLGYPPLYNHIQGFH